MIFMKRRWALSLRASFVMGGIAASLAAQEAFVTQLKVPEELQNIPFLRTRIFEDVNQDGRLDLIVARGSCLFVSYQGPDGALKPFEKIPVPQIGAFDIADILPGGEKEICILQGQGISCFKKTDGHWAASPMTLVSWPTVYADQSLDSLVREHFAVDIDGDRVPELIMPDRRTIRLYRQDGNGIYQFIQQFPLTIRPLLNYPGLQVFSNPIGGFLGEEAQHSWTNDWPAAARYVEWSFRTVSSEILLDDVDRDSRMELVTIGRYQASQVGQRASMAYEYQIHRLDRSGRFEEEPSQKVRDPYGVWLSANRVDIRGTGQRDLLTCQVSKEGSLVQRPRIRMEIVLAPEKGDYPLSPSQVLETSDYPLGHDTLADINGDGLKELFLLHPITSGFSLASIIRKYVEKSLAVELRILPFKPNQGFSRTGMITKRLNIGFFAGVPIDITGDINGDGAKDPLVLEADKLTAYVLDGKTSGFRQLNFKNVRIPAGRAYEIIDIDRDKKSEIVFYGPDEISLIRIKSDE